MASMVCEAAGWGGERRKVEWSLEVMASIFSTGDEV